MKCYAYFDDSLWGVDMKALRIESAAAEKRVVKRCVLYFFLGVPFLIIICNWLICIFCGHGLP
jgi:hypothetical protein